MYKATAQHVVRQLTPVARCAFIQNTLNVHLNHRIVILFRKIATFYSPKIWFVSEHNVSLNTLFVDRWGSKSVLLSAMRARSSTRFPLLLAPALPLCHRNESSYLPKK